MLAIAINDAVHHRPLSDRQANNQYAEIAPGFLILPG